MTESRVDVRQSRTRDLLDQIATSVDVNGDNLLRSINKELTPPFAMQVTGTHAIQVGAISVQNPETLENRITPPISGMIPYGWTVGNITIPTLNANNITNDTGGPAVLLNITTGHFVRMGVAVNKLGQVVVTLGSSNLSVASASTPKIPANTVAVGQVILQNVGGTIQDVTSASLYTYPGGGSGTGVVEGVILNNQTTPLAITDFIIDSADSKIFTAEYSIIRDEAGGGEVVTQGTIKGIFRDVTGWELVGETFAGDDPGVTFSIDSVTGQVKYTSTDNGVSAARFVAVGTDAVSYSDDGINWTSSTAAEANDYREVVWAPSLQRFVAVSGTGTNRVMYSDDFGVTWNTASATEANIWNGLAWSPTLNLFVAVAETGSSRLMHSSDGITWSNAGISGTTTINGATWRSLVWSPELSLFVGVAPASGTGDEVMYSSDGLTWTGTTDTGGFGWSGITWGAGVGKFVAVANTGPSPRVMYSTDGISWSNAGVTGTNTILYNDVTYSPTLDRFVAVSGSTGGNNCMYSDDGISWTLVADAAFNGKAWDSVSWSEQLGLFTAISSSTVPNTMYSTDGITWTSGSSTDVKVWRDIYEGATVSVSPSGTIKFKKLEL